VTGFGERNLPQLMNRVVCVAPTWSKAEHSSSRRMGCVTLQPLECRDFHLQDRLFDKRRFELHSDVAARQDIQRAIDLSKRTASNWVNLCECVSFFPCPAVEYAERAPAGPNTWAGAPKQRRVASMLSSAGQNETRTKRQRTNFHLLFISVFSNVTCVLAGLEVLTAVSMSGVSNVSFAGMDSTGGNVGL
jgi:hypothetical protein